MAPEEVVSTLTFLVSPVVLISGVGLLLLSMTNRLGRVVDRTRSLSRDMRGANEDVRARVQRQMQMLYRRAHLLRLAIFAATMSILIVAVMILTMLTSYLVPFLSAVIIPLFALCMISLVISLLLFLVDLTVSLNALAIEMQDQV